MTFSRTNIRTRENLEAYLQRQNPNWWELEANIYLGRRNLYMCRDCAAYIITIDRHKGVTPSFLACDSCTAGQKVSSFYRIALLPDGDPTHEWYRPDGEELIILLRNKYGMAEHLLKGGLLLRKIGGEDANDGD